MPSIAVTGASGAVGRRVVARLSAPADDAPDGHDPADGSGSTAAGDVERTVVAIDRRRPGRHGPSVVAHQLDLTTDDLVPAIAGCRSIVHLAEDPARRADPGAATGALDRVLAAATEAGVDHVVLLSSALVYGAHADNPVPLTEAHPARPIQTLAHATIKADLEDRARRWAERSGGRVAVLRPTATLSEGDSSWIGAALRAATAVRPERVDPPVQFLHHDDLAAAVAIAAGRRLGQTYNVAPDGWIGAELFRALRGEADVRMPQPLSELRHQLARRVANRSLLDGLEPYVRFPWVVANDRLRAEGWAPRFSNEEAFVAGTPPPLLTSISPQRRQELALGAAGTAGAAAVGAALWALRRTVR
ncbi:MAG: NAD-dependent epimerase/dehydratase family protein [Actinomycetota bacterium]